MDFNLGNSSEISPASSNHQSVIVLGSGPAGLAAALYTARADLNPLVLTGMELGGQVSMTNIVENYPGFPEGVGGQQLVELFQKQAERFGAHIEFDTATNVDLSARPFHVKTYNREYTTDALIVATGATPVHLNVPGEKEFTGRGVSYCATCDGWFFKDKNVVVVGGGDSALEESIFLTRYAKSITIVHRRNSLRAGALLQKRALEQPKIKYIWNNVIDEVLGQDVVSSLRLKDVISGAVSDFQTDGLFIFVGHKPNTQIFVGQLELDERGYIRTNTTMQTNVPGVYVAGEAGDPNFRQVVTSVGMGAAAGMQVIKYLEENS